MAKKEHSEIVRTPTSFGQGHGAHPTGHVSTDGKHSSVPLPERTMGPDSIPEVFYDHNIGPAPTIRGDKKG